MLANIWTLVRGRNEHYRFGLLSSKMLLIYLAVTLSFANCLANDLYEDRVQQMEDIQQLGEAQAEQNGLVAFLEQMNKDSNSQLQPKMDFLNNCGKEFDKLFDFFKTHKNVTTEPPKHTEDLKETTYFSFNTKGNTIDGVNLLKNTNPAWKNIQEVLHGAQANSTVAVPMEYPSAEKKGEVKPLERYQQSRPVKTKQLDNKGQAQSPVVEVIDEVIDEEANMMDQLPYRDAVLVPKIFQKNGIINKPTADINNIAAEKTVSAQSEDRRQAENSFPALLQSEEQLLQAVIPKSSDIQVQELIHGMYRQEIPSFKGSLQYQQMNRAALPATAWLMGTANTPALALSQVPLHKIQNTESGERAELGAKRMQIIGKPVWNIFRVQQQTSILPNQVSLKQSQVVKSMNQPAENQNPGIEAVTQISYQQPQTKRETCGYGQPLKPLKSAVTISDQQPQIILSAVQGYEQQPLAGMPATEVSEQLLQAKVVVHGLEQQPQAKGAAQCSEQQPKSVKSAVTNSEQQPRVVLSAAQGSEQQKAGKAEIKDSEQPKAKVVAHGLELQPQNNGAVQGSEPPPNAVMSAVTNSELQPQVVLSAPQGFGQQPQVGKPLSEDSEKQAQAKTVVNGLDQPQAKGEPQGSEQPPNAVMLAVTNSEQQPHVLSAVQDSEQPPNNVKPMVSNSEQQPQAKGEAQGSEQPPNVVKPTVTNSEQQPQVVLSAVQGSEKPPNVVKPTVTNLEKQPQVVLSAIQCSEQQPQAKAVEHGLEQVQANEVVQGSEKPPTAVKSAVTNSEEQPQVVFSAAQGSEQEPQAGKVAIEDSEQQSQAKAVAHGLEYLQAKGVQQPKSMKFAMTNSEQQHEAGKVEIEDSEQPKAVAHGLELQPQNNGVVQGSEQPPNAVMSAVTNSELQPQVVLSAAQGFGQQSQDEKTAIEYSEPEQTLKQKLRPQQQLHAVKPEPAIVPLLVQQVVKPTATVNEVQAKQASQPNEYTKQFIFMQPSVIPDNSIVRGQAKLVATENRMVPASPGDSLVSQPNSHLNGNPVMRSQFAPQNFPSEPCILGYNMFPKSAKLQNSNMFPKAAELQEANISPKAAGLQSSGYLEDKAINSRLEYRDMPENQQDVQNFNYYPNAHPYTQDNYVYYQD